MSWRERGAMDGLMTLDEFIAQALSKRKGWPSNGYVDEPGFDSLYVRLAKRSIEGEMRWMIDLASAQATKPGSGAFTSLVVRIQMQYPEFGIFAECVLNPRLHGRLLKLGFVASTNPDCYHILPTQRMTRDL
jgi:hypothetical protein